MQGETVDPASPSNSDQAVDTSAAKAQIARREQLRQSYLGAMGIQTWFPRYQLTNAQPARPFDWIEEDARALAEAESTNAAFGTESSSTFYHQKERDQPRAGYSPTKPADILGQFITPSKPAKNIKQEAQPSPEPVKQLTGSASKFRLVIKPISDDCLVVAEMPHSGLNQFSRYHQRLLDDILRALKLDPEDPQTFREFVWPMTESRGLLSQLNQDDYAAADAVCAYLSNQYGLSRRRFILLFGQSAARFVMDPEKNFEQLRGIHQGTHTDQWFAVTHGLNELMKQSILKREAWQDLAPLLAKTPKEPERI
ncbi:hypothetical protein [Endozoicomonas sp. SCSIO W0465]|uniref:hypothetical protein n=1 Tax=Endozoicomonas sp. SCSIO W0465 TaxID=2918516 RepID=UPI002075C49A|nr:hypothetical protein [Endozoicomonas sp. SCSIO W0465]USE35153.1 hypothetical protein MJO57_24080 [Endozoicomonas sp. SCSIO W0465]